MSDLPTQGEHDVIEGLLAAYALDAVGPDEAATVERHVQSCPRCRAELDSYRELASAIGTSMALESAEPPPAALWNRISAGLSGSVERSSSAVGVPMPALSLHPTGAAAGAPEGDVRPPGSRRIGPAGSGRRGGRRTFQIAGVLAAAAAVAAIAVLGVQLVRVNGQLSQTKSALTARGPSAAAEAALSTPGHRLVRMVTPEGAQLAEFVVVPDGQGYMVSSELPAIPDDETYQLWGMIAGQPISLGLLGHLPSRAAFTVSSALAPSALAITIEPAGGVATPDRTPVATGALVAT
ncbi:MAG: anti-sigma factor [Acidimicrobiales bacterium]